jgi:hypothetical protein
MADEYYAFTVQEVDENNQENKRRFGQIFCGTDSEATAINRCSSWHKAAFVRRSSDNEIIYRNY